MPTPNRPTFKELAANPRIVEWTLLKGQKVPMHKHEPGDEHITRVVSGEITIEFANSDLMFHLSAGNEIDFNEHQQEHEIEALTDAVFLNINKVST